MNKDNELKNCPCCNSPAKWDEVGCKDKGFEEWKYGILCTKCTIFTGFGRDKDFILKVWNTRHQKAGGMLNEISLKRYLKGSVGWLNHIKDDDLDLLCGVIGQWQSMNTSHPQHPKVLSVEEILRIINNVQVPASPKEDEEILEKKWIIGVAKAIHQAMPARKEVKWPEKMNRLHKGVCGCEHCVISVYVNDTRDACIKAYEEALPAQQPDDEAIKSLGTLFDACQNLLPFKGSIKIYDSVENVKELYEAMEKAEAILAKRKEK